MSVVVSETVNAPREKVWAVITDIENAQKNISSITKVEVLERPSSGFLGFKWRETRTMFGREATETMWITRLEENRWYETTAHNSGCIYNTLVKLDELPAGAGVKLSMEFKATPRTLAAKLFSPLGLLFRGVIKKALQQDLRDLKRVSEGQ